jgi:hypothetical protein
MFNAKYSATTNQSTALSCIPISIRVLVCFSVLALGASAQQVTVTPEELQWFPGVADSNSPLHWRNGQMIVFNSDGMPVRSEGTDVTNLRRVRAVKLDSYAHVPMWIEATHVEPDGTLFAWYHHEVGAGCEGRYLSAPEIGMLVSTDNGISFSDLGIILSSGEKADCTAENGYFAGGNGDFSVLLDEERRYFYIYYSNYAGPLSAQGIAVARLAYEDRLSPAGNVWKRYGGEWNEAGLGGFSEAVLPAVVSWASPNTDAFWGPSLHYNTYLNQYVMLMNRACCEPGWPPEGIYISFAGDLANPAGWSPPRQILANVGWYRMALGLGSGETDKRVSRRARLFVGSDSRWVLTFTK